MKSALSASLMVAFLLGGCASGPNQSPSLAPRPIEKVTFDEPAGKPAPAAEAPDAGLQKQIDGFAARIDQSARDFDAALPVARTAIDKGARAPQGSDAWVSAQQSLTSLQTAAEASSSVLSDIDELYLARLDTAIGGGSVAGLDALRTIRERAAAQTTAQRETLAKVSAPLG